MPESTVINLLTLREDSKNPSIYKVECDRTNCNRRFSTGCHHDAYIGKSFVFDRQNLPACSKASEEDIKEWNFGRQDSEGNLLYTIRLPAKEKHS